MSSKYHGLRTELVANFGIIALFIHVLISIESAIGYIYYSLSEVYKS